MLPRVAQARLRSRPIAMALAGASLPCDSRRHTRYTQPRGCTVESLPTARRRQAFTDSGDAHPAPRLWGPEWATRLERCAPDGEPSKFSAQQQERADHRRFTLKCVD